MRVMDVSDTIAGQLAARLLADHGAAVTLLRRPSTPAGASPGMDLHLNHTKSVQPCPTDGWESALGQCARDIDVVVVSDHGEAAIAAGLARHALVAVATDFADQGPYRDWHGSELIHQALSGSMHYTGLAGRPPLDRAGRGA
ncbi:hypothetical protein [Streptomyces sp. NPDC059455]|uniref:hypothetical protein n=1 Tax=Streptomyces sp. NPDC059455 TaxID=3346837 RepID=UPI0036AD0EC1